MSYQLMWSPRDKVDILNEIKTLRAAGYDEEISRVLAYMNSIADQGAYAVPKNIHMMIGGRGLYSTCPFGTIGAFYAYNSPPTDQLYLLAFSDKFLNIVGTAAARLNNVP